jgi:hypothetical protein
MFSTLPRPSTSRRHPFQQLAAEVLVRHLAAPEAQRHLHLVAGFEEAGHVAHLDVVVMGVRVGTELHLLDLDRLLLLARLGFAFLLFVLELAEIHDLADGRIGVGRNLHQVEAGLRGHVHGLGGVHDADVFAVRADQADLGGADRRSLTRGPVSRVGGALWGLRAIILGRSAGGGRVFPDPERAGRDATETVEGVVEDATETVEGVVEDATETLQGLTEGAGDAAETATEAVEGATEGAADAAGDAAETAVEAGESAVDAASDAASDAAEAVTDAVTGTDAGAAAPSLNEALSLDGFDFDTALAAIEGSDIAEMTKRAATAALEGARDNPDLLPAALEQARSLLGL